MYEPTVMMTLDMTLVMAVRHGVLVEGSASYFRQVREAVGDNTAWSHWHRLATGQSNANEPAATSRQQAQAALHLYRETFRRIEPAMTADRRDFAGATVAVVDAALDMIS